MDIFETVQFVLQLLSHEQIWQDVMHHRRHVDMMMTEGDIDRAVDHDPRNEAVAVVAESIPIQARKASNEFKVCDFSIEKLAI
jgi:hypothetical protein